MVLFKPYSKDAWEASREQRVGVATTGGVIRYYEFQHYFSKMTIWMSLEFTVEGKRTPALTRAFYDNMFQLAPGNMYFGPRSQQTP